jgi:hypothetical protein
MLSVEEEAYHKVVHSQKLKFYFELLKNKQRTTFFFQISHSHLFTELGPNDKKLVEKERSQFVDIMVCVVIGTPPN